MNFYWQCYEEYKKAPGKGDLKIDGKLEVKLKEATDGGGSMRDEARS